MLGSCYGSTGPASIDPATGRRHGPRFPAITFEDIVRAQHLLLTSMGVTRLLAVAGSSLGGYQAFQWAVSFPGFASGIIALDTAPRDLFDSGKAADELVSSLSRHPNWNGGAYDGPEALREPMTALRIATLKSYGFAEQLHHIADPAERERIIAEVAADWAAEFDANSLIALRRAMGSFDVEDRLGHIRAPLLYVLADTDAWFPARIGQEVMAKLDRAGVAAHFHEVKSPHGHYATTREPEKWTPVARRFLQSL
jgi:homoserine O-acetyltransferase